MSEESNCAVCGGTLAGDRTCPRCEGRTSLAGAQGREPAGSFAGATASSSEANDGLRFEFGEVRIDYGTVLQDRFRVVAPVGNPSAGGAFQAEDLVLGQPVALVFFPESICRNPAFREALYEDVRLARRLAQGPLCRIFDVGEWRGFLFLTRELVAGEDLAALLRRIGGLPPQKALEWAGQLCSGLHAAHEAGLRNVGLHPETLLIDERGELRITDLGLGGRAMLGADPCHGRAVDYMAPERLLDGTISVASDMYTVGLLLVEMLTGLPPHPDRRPEDIIARHQRGQWPELSAFPGLNDIISRCLAVDPHERPPSAAALGEMLAGVVDRSRSERATQDAGGKLLAALMFTDLVDSVALQQRVGTENYMRYVARHDEIFRQCLVEAPGARILNETGDGFLVRFVDPADALNTALRLQFCFHEELFQGEPMRIRIGLHSGIVTQMEERVRGEMRAVGMPINLTARLMDLAVGGQILMSRAVYEEARNYVRAHPPVGRVIPDIGLEWRSHGEYQFKGASEPVEVFEAGAIGIAPFTAPEGGKKAARLESTAGPKGGGKETPSPDELKDADIFIAFAPVDDRSVMPNKSGWITQFHDNLEVRLEQLSGEPVKIWRDRAAQIVEPSAEFLAALSGARTMVSVVSPPFVKTPCCVRELTEYWQRAERDGNFRVSNKPRILKVVKTPVPPGLAPPEVDRLFAQLAGFEFFETDPESGRHWEYDDAFGERAKQRYYERIYDLAYEIRDVLQAVRAGADSGSRMILQRKVIFVAETTSDLQVERDKLKRELLERGHRVVPALPLPLTGPEFEKEVRLLLEEADLAVHLVGGRYGMVPEDTAGSVVELQNRYAAERSRAHGLRRLIWMPRDVEARDSRQEAFLHALTEDPETHRGGEVVQDTMENFKLLLLDALTPSAVEEDRQTFPAEEAPRTIYLIYEERDEEGAELLEDVLFDLGFEVTTPHFDGDEAEISKMHRHNLLHCDAALVYYGSSSRPWVEMKLMDLMQAPGYGRQREMLAKSVFVAPSDDRRKARFRTHLADVIRPMSALIDAATLEPFVARLRRGQEKPA